MSIESWKNEFYPVDADDKSLDCDMSIISHSLRKWQGLTEENLEKHGIKQNGRYLIEKNQSRNSFEIGGGTCALCQYYHNHCYSCSLMKANGKSCDDGAMSSFSQFVVYSNPQAMIDMLQWTLEFYTAQERIGRSD